MRNKTLILISIMTFGFCLGFYTDLTVNNISSLKPNTTCAPLNGNLKTSSISWSHAKVISDNVNGTKNWNTGISYNPDIAVDGSDNLHVVWYDDTNLEGCSPLGDKDIFYAKYSATTGKWSHTKVISDNVNGTKNWNTGTSSNPAIAVDGSDNLHVVWYDNTNLEDSGPDHDIFYANYSVATGKWSHAKVISDNINGTKNWNTGSSFHPDIAVDGSENIHVVWQDVTNLEGCGGADWDIFYANYTAATGNWSHTKVISDNVNGTKNWNTGSSENAAIDVDDFGNVYVTWQDDTNLEGCGGGVGDRDIFIANYSAATGKWSHTKVISDNVNGTKNWNTEYSFSPAIAVDDYENVHVVWHDGTNLEGCGSVPDYDIFYANYSAAMGQWSHAKVISDNVNGTKNWNIGTSEFAAIDVDDYQNVHVVWGDKTNLEGSGTDYDIFYASSSAVTGNWSHTKVISDNVNGTKNWNTGDSRITAIAIDGSDNIHVVWRDETNLEGSDTDYDIFYAKGTFPRGGLYLPSHGDDDDDDEDDEGLDIGIVVLIIVLASIGVGAAVIAVLIKKGKTDPSKSRKKII